MRYYFTFFNGVYNLFLKGKISSAGEDVEKLENVCAKDKNIKWFRLWKLKNYTHNYHRDQQFYF
jgi:hypothetical protein